MEMVTEQETIRIKGIIEAILFAAGEAVELKDLCRVLSLDRETVKTLMDEMAFDYQKVGRGLRMVQIENSWQLSTKPEYYDFISGILNQQEKTGLSRAALETLSIIAYRQPVTRVDIDHIRGVSSNSSVQKLLDRGLIKEAGRLEAPGRPILYKTTATFLKTIGIHNLEALPSFEAFASGEQQVLKIEMMEEEGDER